MSDIAFVVAEDASSSEMEEMREVLGELSEQSDTTFFLTNVDVEVLDERELKEYLGKIIGILDYEINEQS